jgi:cyclase
MKHMKQLTPSVYVSDGIEGCNTGFVVTSEGVFAHDAPMLKEQAKAWAAEIAKHGPLRYVVSGEPHRDHITGLCFMGGTLIGHEGAREEILKMTVDEYKATMARFHPDEVIDKDFHFRAPDIAIRDSITIYLGKHTFKILVMPGHTRWNVCTFVPEERVIFVSDTITGDVSVLTDALPGEWIEKLKFIQTLDVDYIVCGHGEVKDKNYIPEFIKGIQTWLDVVDDAIKKGMTLKEAQKIITMEKEFPDILEKCRWKPDIVPANVASIYAYLQSKGK